MIIITPDILEKAKSNRSHCYRCNKKIGKGVPRLIVITRITPLYKRSVCYKCSSEELSSNIDILKKEISSIVKMKIKLNMLIKSSGKELILESLGE